VDSFEIRVGKASGSLALCVPYIVLEPVIGRLTAQSYLSTAHGASSDETRDDIAERLNEVNVPVCAELGGVELRVSDLLALAPGDVIPLTMAPGGDVSLRVGQRIAFLGQPGTRGRRAAVQITGVFDDPERNSE